MSITKRLLNLIMCSVGIFIFTNTYADDLPIAPKKTWTFMVFLNGNNNLDRFGERNIKGMEKVGSNDNINIIVQWASMRTKQVNRLYIQKSSDRSRVTSPIIQSLGTVDMGSYKSLDDFIAWTVEHYPAEHYFIDVWNHGGGWQRSSMAIVNKNISYDALTGNVITTEQLGMVMGHAAARMGHKVDIYGSDACLMGMAEVANEMSDYVHYFVGSQATEPGQGWPYSTFLARWVDSSAASPLQVSQLLTEEYVKAYSPGGIYPACQVTFSALNLEEVPALNAAMRNLSEDIRLLSPAVRLAFLHKAHGVMTFDYKPYADLLSLISVLSSSAPSLMLNQQRLSDVALAAGRLIVANKGTNGYTRATGLSIWLPLRYSEYSYDAERYSHLHFNVESQWGEALAFLLQGVNKQNEDEGQDEDYGNYLKVH